MTCILLGGLRPRNGIGPGTATFAKTGQTEGAI